LHLIETTLDARQIAILAAAGITRTSVTRRAIGREKYLTLDSMVKGSTRAISVSES
jgi:hypothetical protein